MKISPVTGTSIGSIGSSPQSGVSPSRVERAKAIASGKPADAPVEAVEEKIIVPQVAPATNKVIKMNTNANPTTLDALQEEVPEAAGEPEQGISDTVSTQAKTEPEAIQPVSPQIAAIAKQRRAAQVKEREAAEQLKLAQEQLAQAKALEERIKSGQALSVLKELGVSYDDLTQQILGQPSIPDVHKLKEEILQGVRKELADKDVAQEQAVFEHMQKNVKKMAFTSDKFPLVKGMNKVDDVMNLITRAWKENGEVLDEEEALQMIEDELKGYESLYQKKEPETTTPAAVERQPNQPVQRPGVKTLTNKDSARPAMSRRQRALAAFTGQIK